MAVLGMAHSSLAAGLAAYPRAKSPCAAEVEVSCFHRNKLLPAPSKTSFPDMLRRGVQFCPCTRVAHSQTAEHRVCVYKQHICTALSKEVIFRTLFQCARFHVIYGDCK